MTVDYKKISTIDYARLAAYIDGEGCIRLQPSGHKRAHRFYTVMLVIGQSEHAGMQLIEWLHQTFGGRVNKGKGKYCPMYYWMLGATALDIVLVRCLPYLLVKGDQVRLALEYRGTVTDKTFNLPDSLVQHREEIRMKLHQLKHGHKSNGLDVQEGAIDGRLQ